MHNVFLSAINAWTRVPACRAVPTPCARWCSTRRCAGARRATRGTPGWAAPQCPGTPAPPAPAGHSPRAAPWTTLWRAPVQLATWALPHIADSQPQQLLLLPQPQLQLHHHLKVIKERGRKLLCVRCSYDCDGWARRLHLCGDHLR